MTAAHKDSPTLRWARAKVIEVFGADLRSLATFRIVLALLVLADLINRATDLSAHYSDEGVLPRTALLEEVLNPWRFSLNLMNGYPLFQALLFGVAALAALGLLVGYRTRLMTVIVWVLLLSIQWRNPLVISSGDILLHLLLFWGMFLPLGACWSVDRTLKAAPPRLSMRFLSLATFALFMQIAFVYWFAAMLKSGPEWRVDGTALYYALSIDRFATPIGVYLLHFPELLKVLTFATILLEAFGPFLLFCPFFTAQVRTLAVLAFMGLHFGIWLTMDIGIFQWVSAFCMVCFLPTWFWDKVVAKLRAAFPKRPSNIARRLQHAALRLVHDRLSPLRARLSPVAGAGQPSVAGLAAQDSQLGNHAARMVVPSAPTAETPRQQGETRSDDEATAEQETRHGAASGSEPTMLRSSLATNLLALFFLLYVFCWNLTTVSEFSMPDRVRSPGFFLGLDQSWAMFAPYPSKSGGWYVIPGTLRSGQQVDLLPVTRDDFRPHEVSWEKPQYVVRIYKNQHWRKYFSNILKEEYADQRLHFGRYICREWNARHAGAEQLTTFQITYMLEETLPDYRRQATPQKVVLWEHNCF